MGPSQSLGIKAELLQAPPPGSRISGAGDPRTPRLSANNSPLGPPAPAVWWPRSPAAGRSSASPRSSPGSLWGSGGDKESLFWLWERPQDAAGLDPQGQAGLCMRDTPRLGQGQSLSSSHGGNGAGSVLCPPPHTSAAPRAGPGGMQHQGRPAMSHTSSLLSADRLPEDVHMPQKELTLEGCARV